MNKLCFRTPMRSRTAVVANNSRLLRLKPFSAHGRSGQQLTVVAAHDPELKRAAQFLG